MNHLDNTRFIFDKYARAYKEKYLDQENYAPMLLEFLKEVPEGGKVLDLGCGPGNISRFLLDHRNDLQITGIDIAPAMIEEARKLNPEATFYKGNVLEFSFKEDEKFDGVVSGFVLPYLDTGQVRLHLKQIAAMLKPEGVGYLSFLHGDENDSGFAVSKNTDGESLYMHYHSVDLVERLIDLMPGLYLKQTFSFPSSGEGGNASALTEGVGQSAAVEIVNKNTVGMKAQAEGDKKTPRSQNGEPTNMEIMMILRSS